MKKKKDWQTKAKRRKYKEQDKGILGIVFIVNHFWKHFAEWIEEMEDPRNQSYITYTQTDYVYMGILSEDKKLQEMPHSDSLNNYLQKLSLECLAELRTHKGTRQKNGIYDIEHLNSRDSNALKNRYLLTQISDIIMQIYPAWNPCFREIKQSIKNTSSTLLGSFRGLKDVQLIFLF